MSVGWLRDGSEEALRTAMAVCAPHLANLPIRINVRHAQSNPLWWSTSAEVDERFVAKFAGSEVRAIRLWREGVVLDGCGPFKRPPRTPQPGCTQASTVS